MMAQKSQFLMNLITIHPKPGNPLQGLIKIGPKTFPCALGRSGSSWKKREGDGITPLLNCRPLWGFYHPDKGPKPRSRLPFIALHPSMGWCDETGHASYNRPVKLPFTPSHEKMWREDELFDIGIVLDFNISCRKQGMGSAIFFHIARPGFTPTEGCIAVQPKVMQQILPLIGKNTIFQLV
jgi:L,D-peptidoglycan transpeptidase YkuD (ErfK/YbiS/YcfS/YnhG family)